MQYTVFLVLAPIAGVIAILSTILSWQRRKGNAFGSLTWLLACICGFLLSNFLELITGTAQETFFWARVSYIFIPFIPVFWIRFALDYSGHRLFMQKKFFWVLCLVPVITIFCAWVPSMQPLLWEEYVFEPVGNHHMVMLVTRHGIWFWIYAAMGYFFDIVGTILILKVFFRTNKIFQRQSIWIIIGATLPLSMNFLYITRVIPGFTKDYSPISYTIAGICFTIGMIRYQLLDLMPVARATLVDEIRDGVIVLDSEDRVVDINPAVRTMLLLPDDVGVGNHVQDLFVNWKEHSGNLVSMTVSEGGEEICIHKDGKEYWYNLRLSDLRDGRARISGKLILIHDVTSRRQAEIVLRQAHDELENRVIERTAELAYLNATLEERIANRTHELSALYELSTIASQAVNVSDLIRSTLTSTISVIPSQIGAVYLLNDQEEASPSPSSQYIQADQQGIAVSIVSLPPVLAGNHELIARLKTARKAVFLAAKDAGSLFTIAPSNQVEEMQILAAPLLAENKLSGLMLLANEKGVGFKMEDIKLLSSIAVQTGLAILSNTLRQQTIVYEERQRLSRDLHDSVTQSLYGLVAITEAGQAQLDNGKTENIGHTLVRIGQTARQILKEMRLYIYELRPPELEQEGLVGAIQFRLTAVEGRSNISARLIADDNIQLSPQVARSLYSITSEALNNILRHTLATEVLVKLQKKDGLVELEIVDNGCGFDPQRVAGQGMGLENMRERAQKMNGKFSLTSTIGKGTRVYVSVCA